MVIIPTVYHIDIETLYVAYLGRPADAPGLGHWEHAADADGYPVALGAALAESAEFKALVPDQSPAHVVTAIYQNLFGRAPDAAGLDFWTHALDSGSATLATIGGAIAGGARVGDGETRHAKVDAALTFTNELRTPSQIAAYSGDSANAALREALAQVTADHPDLPVAGLNIPLHQDHVDALQQLYIAYFHRPADPDGLAFWNGALDSGTDTLDSVAAQFAQSAEYQNAIAGEDVPHQVVDVYHMLFNREPDAGGFDFWINEIQSGRVTSVQAPAAIAAGATGDDLKVLHNKVLAAIDYTNGLATSDDAAFYPTEIGLQYGKVYLDIVYNDPYPPQGMLKAGPVQPATLVGVHPDLPA